MALVSFSWMTASADTSPHGCCCTRRTACLYRDRGDSGLEVAQSRSSSSLLAWYGCMAGWAS